jgi:hypothetical protein
VGAVDSLLLRQEQAGGVGRVSRRCLVRGSGNRDSGLGVREFLSLAAKLRFPLAQPGGEGEFRVGEMEGGPPDRAGLAGSCWFDEAQVG